jgi:hypothetical protein
MLPNLLVQEKLQGSDSSDGNLVFAHAVGLYRVHVIP